MYAMCVAVTDEYLSLLRFVFLVMGPYVGRAVVSQRCFMACWREPR